MDRDVDPLERRLEAVRGAEVRAERLHLPGPAERAEVGRGTHQRAHRVPPCEEGRDHVPAEEPVRPGDERPHDRTSAASATGSTRRVAWGLSAATRRFTASTSSGGTGPGSPASNAR